MSKFKVGDRVRYTGLSSRFSEPRRVGQKGTVTGVFEHSVKVDWDTPPQCGGVYPENIELFDPLPTPSPSEGDEFTVMRVCASWIDGLPTDLGKTRVIKYLEDRFDTL